MATFKKIYPSLFCNSENGSWTEWFMTRACNSDSGTAWTRTYERNCTNPEPKYGGDFCDGSSKNVTSCLARKFILDRLFCLFQNFFQNNLTFDVESEQINIAG